VIILLTFKGIRMRQSFVAIIHKCPDREGGIMRVKSSKSEKTDVRHVVFIMGVLLEKNHFYYNPHFPPPPTKTRKLMDLNILVGVILHKRHFYLAKIF